MQYRGTTAAVQSIPSSEERSQRGSLLNVQTTGQKKSDRREVHEKITLHRIHYLSKHEFFAGIQTSLLQHGIHLVNNG